MDLVFLLVKGAELKKQDVTTNSALKDNFGAVP